MRNHKRKTGSVKFTARTDYEPFRLDRSEPTVKLARAVARSVGLKPKLKYADGGVDASWLVKHGLPTITLGAGQHSPHTVDEYVNVREYLDGCRLAVALAGWPRT